MINVLMYRALRTVGADPLELFCQIVRERSEAGLSLNFERNVARFALRSRRKMAPDVTIQP